LAARAGSPLRGGARESSDPLEARPIVGAGVGKGTQPNLLHQRLGACHLSTGDVFRAAGRRSECELSPAMKEAILA
jgi:hypothetical protein